MLELRERAAPADQTSSIVKVLQPATPTAAGDPDPFGGNRSVRLTMGHIVDKSKGGEDLPNNLRAVCTNCNEGLQNISPPKPDRLQLLTYIRKATREDQLAVLAWLRTKFRS